MLESQFQNSETLVELGAVNTPQFILALVGLLMIAVMHHFKIKGDILIGILGTWILGMIAQAAAGML